MCPVPCPGITGEDLGKIIIIIPKDLYNSLLWAGPLYWGRQPFRVLNVITISSCWKCGGSRYDLVVSGVCPLSHLGLSFLWRTRKKHEKNCSVWRKKGRMKITFSLDAWVKMWPGSCVSCLLWLDFLCSLKFLSNLSQLFQFGCEGDSVIRNGTYWGLWPLQQYHTRLSDLWGLSGFLDWKQNKKKTRNVSKPWIIKCAGQCPWTPHPATKPCGRSWHVW